jgi:hypothetical protein
VLLIILFVEQIANNIVSTVLVLTGYIPIQTFKDWFSIFQYIHLGVFLAALAIIVIVDIVLDVKQYGFWTGFFTERDAFRFRLDMLCFFPGVLFLIIGAVLESIRDAKISKQGYDDVETTIVYAVNMFFLCIYFLFAWLLSGGNVIISLIVFALRKEKDQEEDPLTKLVIDDKGYKLLEQYCKHEFSTENLLAYSMMLKFKEKKDVELLRADALYTIQHYATVGSLSEVNLPKDIRQKILDAKDRIPSMNIEEIQTLFYDYEQEVRMNLLDTFKRFVYTPHYKRYTRRSSIKL